MSTIYTGQTIRATITDIVDATGLPIPAPDVVVTVTDPTGTVTTPTVAQEGETYFTEFTSDVVGRHVIRATASAGSGTWKTETQVMVYDFAT